MMTINQIIYELGFIQEYNANLAGTLYKLLAHGNEEHRAWLKEALDNFFIHGKPIPPPRQ